MKIRPATFFVLLIGCFALLLNQASGQQSGLAIVNKVRFFPAPAHEKDLLGGKVTLKAIAYESGMADSSVVTGRF